MKFILLSLAAVLLVSPAHADGTTAPTVVVTPVLKTTMTNTGQPIALPQNNAEVSVEIYEIAPGATLPQHKHPYPRYAYVLAGTLRVTISDTGASFVYKPGDVIIEAIGEWHQGANIGNDQVKLVVIDQVEKGQSNVVLRK